MMRSLPIIALGSSVLLNSVPACAADATALTDVERRVLVESLEVACAKESWVGIHAAEALLALGHPEPVRRAFGPQADSTEPKYRVGVWRVLARAHADKAVRAVFIARIRDTLVDERSPDRLHALESLAKLGARIETDAERGAVLAMSGDPAAAAFALWRLVREGDTSGPQKLVELLRSPDADARSRAAFVIARLPEVRSAAAPALAAALAKEPADGPAHAALAAAVGGGAVRRLASSASAGARYTAAAALVESGTAADRAVLAPLLADSDDDVRVAAAFALLAIDARHLNPPATQPRK